MGSLQHRHVPKNTGKKKSFTLVFHTSCVLSPLTPSVPAGTARVQSTRAKRGNFKPRASSTGRWLDTPTDERYLFVRGKSLPNLILAIPMRILSV